MVYLLAVSSQGLAIILERSRRSLRLMSRSYYNQGTSGRTYSRLDVNRAVALPEVGADALNHYNALNFGIRKGDGSLLTPCVVLNREQLVDLVDRISAFLTTIPSPPKGLELMQGDL